MIQMVEYSLKVNELLEVTKPQYSIICMSDGTDILIELS